MPDPGAVDRGLTRGSRPLTRDWFCIDWWDWPRVFDPGTFFADCRYLTVSSDRVEVIRRRPGAGFTNGLRGEDGDRLRRQAGATAQKRNAGTGAERKTKEGKHRRR